MNISRPLAGMAAILCAAGLALTGTAGANAAEKQNTGLPDHIVNGDFSYPVWDSIPLSGVPSAWNPDFHWTSILSDTGQAYAGPMVPTDGVTAGWQAIPGFDADRFGWKSTQADCQASNENILPGQCKAGAVELQHTSESQHAEITAAQEHTAIYQDIATIPGAVYTWSLKHASLDGTKPANSMQVLIGDPGRETAQEAERVTVNGHGDQRGPVGTIIRTTSTAAMPADDLPNQWETYEGTYVATSTVTRFTFKAINGHSDTEGNLVDDISFEISYPLTYELNGGAGVIPNKEVE